MKFNLFLALFFLFSISNTNAQKNTTNETLQGGGYYSPSNLVANAQDSISSISLKWSYYTSGTNPGRPYHQYILRKYDTLDFDTIADFPTYTSNGFKLKSSYDDTTAIADTTYIYMIRYGAGQLRNSKWLYNYDSNQDTATLRKQTIVGINEYVESEISIYPNPVSNQLVIEGVKLLTDFKIMDVSGRIYMADFTKEVETITVNVSHLSPGVYLVSINNSTTKFIKQ